jgi:metal-responsive CopG/Arc/MetJ family transcriptional regulator
MKTAVSIPDDLLRLADAEARRLRVSRSQVYIAAVSEFLEQESSQRRYGAVERGVFAEAGYG